jgi:hypothetical protein
MRAAGYYDVDLPKIKSLLREQAVLLKAMFEARREI